MSLILDEHREYLSDHARLRGFQRAIEAVVQEGAVVVDLGSGTGVLGLMACRAGAARVYSIESTSMIGVAREIAHANGVADRITFVREHSLQAELPERADVVVADQIGRFGFEAGVLHYFADAHRRFLKPGGVTIPGRIDLLVAPVESDAMWSQVDFWDTTPLGLEMGAGRTIARNTGYPVRYSREDLLGPDEIVASLDPSVENDSPIHGRASLRIERDGTLHGAGGWFAAEMSPGVTMTNSPLAEERIKRRNVFFPVERPVAVTAGDRVEVSMSIVPSEVMVDWDVTVTGADGTSKAASRHSTFAGMLLSAEDLARTRPDFAPRLTPRGEARRTVLSLCDGDRPLAAVEEELYRRHGDLFPSPEDAALFAAEVVTRYAT
ncbi:MAG: 50S ribosomal protein L11 methyltransferase [Thermoleophilaceae bacterium]|nr:50S ribosomal protein L11 methyltransferase [Thermoleophilaceae bacterium]